ncbi:MAG: O-antigen ligase family protein [Pseudomonadota bacterium]
MAAPIQAALTAGPLRDVLAAPIDHRALGWLVGLTAACGALVFREPSPYELLFLPMAGLLFAFGLPIHRRLAPLVLMVVLISAGALIGLSAVRYETAAAIQFAVITVYLLVTSLVFAAYVADDPLRGGRIVLMGTVAAGAIASLAAVIGYVGGIEAFMRFGRAKGTFEDPNVLGAFLVFPACILLTWGLSRPVSRALIPLALFSLVAIGLFLSFSRAAWGLLVLCGAITVFFTFATSADRAERRRIGILTLAGIALALAGLMLALSIPATADLIADRARLTQSYDSGYLGRFDRYSMGLMIVLERPLGLGSIQFRQYFPEEIHNVYLNTFLAYGWLGGGTYLVAVLWSLNKCLRLLQRRDALRVLTIPVAAAFIGMALEGMIIDTDHWRHWFLLFGLVWGLDGAPPMRRG